MKRIGLLLLASAALLVAVACETASVEEPAFPNADIELDAAADGNLIKLNKGQTLKIGLEADPSRGFNWAPSAIDESILRQAGTHYAARSTNWVVFKKSTGVQTLLFEAIDVGQTALTLVYRRQGGEDTEFSDLFSVRLVVR